jgi:probable phosphomutase (TIGR03848 family)
VPKIYLVRHGRTPANEKGILAGRTKGIYLDDIGIKQAEAVAKSLSQIKFKKIIVSPMERCQQTAKIIITGMDKTPKPVIESGINECDYGDWSNKKLSALRSKPLWKTIQEKPSLVQFPNGEKMNQMLARVKNAIFEHALKLKSDENLLVVSHGDPIRSFIADCLGIHLDNFQRITIDPCSVSVVIISNDNVQVISVNNNVKVDQISKKKNKRIGSVLGGGAG